MSTMRGALWVASTHASTTAAQQTLEALRTRDLVDLLSVRYAMATTAHRAGRLFEVMHAHSFNNDALAAGSPLRALVTEWMPGGSQTAAADLVVVDGRRVAAQVQAKLYESASGTAHEVAREHYAGMGRLVASDRVDDVGSLLQRRVAMNPESPLLPRYRDAAAHLGDRIEVVGVSSRAVTLDQARRAAGDPARWAAHQVAVSAARQVGVAGATGAGLAALVQVASVIAVARVADAPVSTALASSGPSVVSAGARAGSTAALGEGLRLAATLGALPRVLAVGTLPVAVAASLVQIAGHGVDLAGGRSTAGELASASAATVARSGVVWAFTVAGQAAVPVPVVGALAGAVVGQVTAQALGRGLALGLDAVRDHGGAPDRSGDEPHRLAAAAEPMDVAPVSVDQPEAEPREPVDPEGALEVAMADLTDLERFLSDDAFTLVLDSNGR